MGCVDLGASELPGLSGEFARGVKIAVVHAKFHG